MQTELSDKYEDQYKRLEQAMIALFKYESLLSNEYLVRKFEQDPYNPQHYCLQYVVVQRENSIKNQYVQNELNTRKQYHLILTAILKQYHKVLWTFDQLQLIIRPYFPAERKRIQLKFQVANVDKVKDIIKKADFIKEELIFDTEAYQADKNLIKLYVTTKTEEQAEELFTWLMGIKHQLGLDSIMMINIDYLEEFHNQITERKNNIYLNKQNEKQPHNDFENHFTIQKKEQRTFDEGKGKQRHEKNDYDHNYHNHNRGHKERRGGNRDRFENYVQKSEMNQQQQNQEHNQQKQHYHQKRQQQSGPKQNTQFNLNADEFPALNSEGKN